MRVIIGKVIKLKGLYRFLTLEIQLGNL